MTPIGAAGTRQAMAAGQESSDVTAQLRELLCEIDGRLTADGVTAGYISDSFRAVFPGGGR